MAAITYKDIAGHKKAFIFELDNVLYPEKDYIYQVYYLFASLLEYTELSDAKQTTDLMVAAYIDKGPNAVFDVLKEKLGIDEKFRQNLATLMQNAKLPLKLLLYKNVLSLLQEVVLDRKKLFIVTNGNPLQQLNKLKQIEWHGLEPYLTCYFTEESALKPEPDALELLMTEHKLQRRDMVMIENSETDRLCAQTFGIDYINATEII
jgi:FMN phosphatase YigB (HAD superfamily)